MKKWLMYLLLLSLLHFSVCADIPEGGVVDEGRYALISTGSAVANYDTQKNRWLYQRVLVIDGSDKHGIYCGLFKSSKSVYTPVSLLFDSDRPLYILLNEDLDPVGTSRFTSLEVREDGPHIASDCDDRGDGLIDNHSQWVYKPQGELIIYLGSDWLCLFGAGAIRVVDRELQVQFQISDDRFYSVWAYDGKSRVMLRSHDGGYWVGEVRDKKLVQAEQVEYRSVRKASDNLFLAEYTDKGGERRFRYIGWDGGIVLPGPYVGAGRFNSGLAPVALLDTNYGIDDDGVPSSPRPFRIDEQGLVPVPLELKGEVWGYINEKADWVIEPSYQAAGEFRNGLAPVLVGQRWGFIDPETQIVIRPSFDEVKRGFDDGTYAVVLNRVMGLDNSDKLLMQGIIDRKGAWLVPPMLPMEMQW